MAMYIDADLLVEELRELQGVESPSMSKATNQAIDLGLSLAIRTARKAPTADVAEVKHAKWEINSDGYYPYCSNCKTEPENGVMSKHCPECGAKMDGRSDV